MRVLLVLVVAGFGWFLMGAGWTRAKLSRGSVHDYDHRIRKAWDYQQAAIGTHGFESDEYMRRKNVLDRLVAKRESIYGKKDGIY